MVSEKKRVIILYDMCHTGHIIFVLILTSPNPLHTPLTINEQITSSFRPLTAADFHSFVEKYQLSGVGLLPVGWVLKAATVVLIKSKTIGNDGTVRTQSVGHGWVVLGCIFCSAFHVLG